MALDDVDDLHNAEDHISTLEHYAAELLQALGPEWANRQPVRTAMGKLRGALNTYCRPSCEAFDDGVRTCDESCGCPCHERGEQ